MLQASYFLSFARQLLQEVSKVPGVLKEFLKMNEMFTKSNLFCKLL